MGRRQKREPEEEIQALLNRKPPTTPQEHENLLISLAMKRAEQQLADGTASSQVISHFLKMGATREQLEQDKIRKETELLKTKRDTIESAEAVEARIEAAVEAFGRYRGKNARDGA